MSEPDSPLVDEVVRSPNYGERHGPLDMILLHYTGMETADAALARLADPAAEVSCHYLVHEDGRVVQMVAETARAWHAGRANWAGETDINSRSVGIEIVNRGHDFDYPDFPEPQVAAVIALCRDIAKRRAVAPHRVLGHSDVAPVRKRDPGEKFPWDRLAAAGVGHWVAPEPVSSGRFFEPGARGEPIKALQSMLALYGYGVAVSGLFDDATQAVVTAFQRHFRPARVDGVADVSTIATLHRLLVARAAPA